MGHGPGTQKRQELEMGVWLLHVDALKAKDGVGSPREGGSNEEEGGSESAVRGDRKEARRRDQEERRLRDANCRC